MIEKDNSMNNRYHQFVSKHLRNLKKWKPFERSPNLVKSCYKREKTEDQVSEMNCPRTHVDHKGT